MSIFDQIKNAAHNHPTVKNMAEKIGIDQETAERAIAALTEGHHAEGDTMQVAADKSGIDQGVLSQVMEHVGGEGSLQNFMQILDRDHDGNPLNDITSAAGKLFGKN
ncbi:hypothetical protein [Aurantiacibacter gangjinensis]|uniref:Uncharacterized protein n=1 Tax=Aurantiacibacter gangjinensis TaxID=502682 RepID=A0A0G9MVD2_9SPHN|nr:hypothetical protein [Aurantiacibacter gangjinensis]APE29196.1 hypothetical protein BMF35_a2367 [Aurantiacibacter gangjinensis]KLE33258.1 hypothetical protein AAW01_04710 [Aurantiacibacter gangjinensis]